MKLAGKVAVITGAGSGIGRASAELFAMHGAGIAVFDINEQGARETVETVAANGGKAVAYGCDIADARQVAECVNEVLAEFGHLNLVMNNAAFNRTVPPTPEDIFNISVDHWNNVISVNLSGMLHVSKAAVPHMIESGGGAIVNISSAMGLASSTNATAYSASKSGVIGLTKAMAMDLGPRGIRVNAICPGAVNTQRLRGMGKERLASLGERFPLKRIAQPEDIARAALFLFSEDAALITGAVLPVDGGQSARLAF